MASSPFPCPLEETAASALILLSTTLPSQSTPGSYYYQFGGSKEVIEVESIESENNDDDSSISSGEFYGRIVQEERMIAVVSRCQELQLKAVQKARSKRPWRESMNSEENNMQRSMSSDRVSCSTSSSVEVGVSGRRIGMKQTFSTQMQRQSEAILKLLHTSSISEVRIRLILGDSPDTSKALRMLLKSEKIKRSGVGGRCDPFMYRIA